MNDLSQFKIEFDYIRVEEHCLHHYSVLHYGTE